MLIIEPPPDSFIADITDFAPKKTPFELTDSTKSHSASVVSSNPFPRKTPALLINISNFPYNSKVLETAFSQSDS